MKNKILLSVVLATRNEEVNIERCLKSVKLLADEIIIFDEHSLDKTVIIAKKYGARVFDVDHNDNFHVTKQNAIEKATGTWILQLDADEVITPKLSQEILEVIKDSNDNLKKRLVPFSSFSKTKKLFERHQRLIEERDGKIGKKTGEIVAFFIPRMNIFLGKPLIHGGVYPDPAIRLIKRGCARLPAKDVHEIMEADGEVGWLFNYMEHYDSPTFERYLARNNRYTDLIAKEYKDKKLSLNLLTFLKFAFLLPTSNFLLLYIRHKAILDGFPGFVWSFFSALRFPVSYMKYWQTVKK